MTKKQKSLQLDAPLFHADHHRPRTRRDFISQGFMAGTASAVGLSPLASLLLSGNAKALDLGLDDNHPLISLCPLGSDGAGKIPFLCFDLAGGANIAGSNVLLGGQGGQEDFLSTAGYNKLGVSSSQLPMNGFINNEFGIAFHSLSAFLIGMLEKTSPTTRARVSGMVIPARSENDTGNNPHNPMYGIRKIGAQGAILSLIGSNNSDSGGNSMAPANLILPEWRPTRIARANDSTGLVDTGSLGAMFPTEADKEKLVNIMETMYKLSDAKINLTGENEDRANLVRCAYAKSAENVEKYSQPSTLNPFADANIIGGGGLSAIFSAAELNGDREFEKTATIMKLVLDQLAGAGTITMGGYDYHTGDRITGERRDLRAGRCIGACLEYAARVNRPLMLYVFSDGAVSSNGMEDNMMVNDANLPVELRVPKPQWTSDNQQTAAAFILVFDPNQAGASVSIRKQLGYMSSDGNVVTNSSPAGNSVPNLVDIVLLNYLALHDELGSFGSLFPQSGLVGNELLNYVGFNPVVNGTI